MGIPANLTWKLRAACKGMDTNIFFPVPGDVAAIRHAQSICENCPVRQECLDFILGNEDTGGIWGGTTGRERIRQHNAWRRR